MLERVISGRRSYEAFQAGDGQSAGPELLARSEEMRRVQELVGQTVFYDGELAGLKVDPPDPEKLSGRKKGDGYPLALATLLECPETDKLHSTR